jgi:hypothetical protein
MLLSSADSLQPLSQAAEMYRQQMTMDDDGRQLLS